ncbi:MAG: Flp pilus assembly protein CpaB [Actinomycetota bacterium]|nr:Flp pilus assembly protein CpaB [Actinomycetota bacterium]
MPTRSLIRTSKFSLSSRWRSARMLAAALLAAGALVLAVAPQSGPPAPVPKPETVVLVAAHDLAAGVTIGSADLAMAKRTTTQLPDGALSSEDAAVGRVVSSSVRRGEILTDRRVLGPGLSAGLDAGMVASPVRLVDLEVTALLRPGDRVDILAATDGALTAAVVAAGVLVLAVPLTVPEGRATAEPLGLVVVAVDQDTAGLLASAAASSILTATLLPP